MRSNGDRRGSAKRMPAAVDNLWGTARGVALAALGGLLVASSFLDFRWGWLAWGAFVPILVALRAESSLRRTVVIGLVAGLAVNVPAFQWLVGTIHRFGGFPLSVSLAFYLALSTYSALQFVILAVAFRRTGFAPLAIAAPAIWVSLELVFPNLFPWRLANSQIEFPPLLQIGELTGPFGLSFVMVWAAAAVARTLVEGVRSAAPALVAAAIATAGVVVFGIVRLDAIDRAGMAAPKAKIGLVQGNLSIEEKGNVHYFESNLATYRRLTLELGTEPDVVIWPESVIDQALPRELERVSPGGLLRLGVRRPLLVGALTYRDDPERPLLFNSVLGIDVDGRVLGTSDKQILMPFGEYLPFASIFPSLRQLSPQKGDFEAGAEVVPIDVPGVGRFAPLNCYEDLRAGIARDAVRRLRADVLFAVANDAWFGATAAPYQHEALAAWRAVETRRALVRVTNTGVTDVVEPSGRVTVRLPIFEEVAVVASVPKLAIETVYVRFGPVFAGGTCLLAIGLIGAGRRGHWGRPNRPRSRATSPAS
jgi:apolipoprotein N-acyltransferase